MKKNVFKKLILRLCLFSSIIMLTACPYESYVPIDEGTVTIPEGFEGNWSQSLYSENPSADYFSLTILDEYTANITEFSYSEFDSSYSENNTYELTFSEVNGEFFMNAFDASLGSYFLYRINVDEEEGNITLTEITDNITETFENSEELKQFISENMYNSYFYYHTPETYYRYEPEY